MRSRINTPIFTKALRAGVETMEARTLMSAGTLDPSFGVNGQASISDGSLQGTFLTRELTIDSTGRTLVPVSYHSGKTRVVSLIRLNSNGSVDTSFNAAAALANVPDISQVLLESNGDILVVGTSSIERLTSTGAMDKTFSSSAGGTAPVLLPSGQFVILNEFNFNLSRYNADGSLDTDFGTGGTLDLPNANFSGVQPLGIRLDSTGRIVLSVKVFPTNSTVTFGTGRFLANGQLDTSYGTGGYSVATSATTGYGGFGGMTGTLTIAPDGTIDQLATYYFHSVPVVQSIFAYSSNGKQVGGGPVSGAGLTGIVAQSDGKIVAAGTLFNGTTLSNYAYIDRFTAIAPTSTNLTLDATFDSSGEFLFQPHSSIDSASPLALDPQGKIVVGTTTPGPGLTISRILTAAPSTPIFALSGPTIGTPGSYQNKGNIIAKATDDNLSTYFDAPTPDNDWVGMDLRTPRFITQLNYAPRSGYASRMIGGIFQSSSSADFSTNVINLCTITAAPASGVLTTIGLGVTTPAQYVRYLAPAGSYGNIAELQVSGALEAISGTPIGTPGSYKNTGNTLSNAFDGGTNTFFDAATASGAWVGLDLGAAQIVTQAKFAPRLGYTNRMVGGMIQASNTAEFSSEDVTAYTITATPPGGTLTTAYFSPVGAYRYWRYIGPTGSYCNISELEFDGI